MSTPKITPQLIAGRSTSRRGFLAKVGAMLASLMKADNAAEAQDWAQWNRPDSFRSGKRLRRGTPGAFGTGKGDNAKGHRSLYVQ
jgi:hypothetical protein